jgi:hypothetical protein
LGRVATRDRLADASAEGDDDVNGTSPGRAINPAQPATGQRSSGQPTPGQRATAQPTTAQPTTGQRGSGESATGQRGEPTSAAPPVRRVVRLDAEYLSAGAQPRPAQDAIEPEEEQLIVLPRRSGPWIARLFRWIFS